MTPARLRELYQRLRAGGTGGHAPLSEAELMETEAEMARLADLLRALDGFGLAVDKLVSLEREANSLLWARSRHKQM